MFEAILLILCNIVLSIALVLVNKRIVVSYDFNFMTVLTGFHFAASMFSGFIFLALGYMKYRTVNSYFNIFRIAMVSYN